MEQHSLSQTAKQGNLKAIATLLNKNLQAKGVSAKVNKQGSSLNIRVESQAGPQKSEVFEFLKSGLIKLSPAGIDQITIEAYSLDDAQVEWNQTFPLAPPNSSQNRNKSCAQTDQSKGQKPKVTVISKKSTNPMSSIESLLKSRNGERVAIVAATFLVTSGLWLASILATNFLGQFFVADSDSGDSPQEDLAEATSNTTAESQVAREAVEEEPVTPTSEVFLTNYLDSITTSGLSGTARWCSEKEILSTSLFSPRSYEIIDFKETGDTANATVRIESSNKGGMPIIQNWSFFLSTGETVLERDQRKDGDIEGADKTNADFQNWCIAMVLD